MNGRFLAFSTRFTRANNISIGAAPGSIIAAIMTHHIANITAAYASVHAAGSIIMPVMPGMPDLRVMPTVLMPVPAPITIQIHAIAMTPTRAATRIMRSRRSTASRMVVSVTVMADLDAAPQWRQERKDISLYSSWLL